MRVLALDVGEKRIGVAQADSSTRIAVPVGCIETGGSEWQEIAKIATMYNTNLFVLGLPRSNEGNETQQSAYVRQFAEILKQQIPGARVQFQDESLTSVVAEERLQNSRRSRKIRKQGYAKGEIDAEAAAIILQDFLESLQGKQLEAAMARNGGASQQNTPLEANNTNTKQGKPKMKTAAKWITGIIIVLVLGVAAVGGGLAIREKIRADREAEYAAMEAEMQPRVFDFTIKPGETLADIREHLIEVGYSATEIDAALAADYDFDFLAERPEGASLEGYLFGETQQFYEDTPVTEVIEFYLTEMQEAITENDLEAKFADQGLTLHEGITLASVVQKESPTPEMPTVAQVFLTRLYAGIPLGSDVTVSYALDELDPERDSHSDNQSALGVDSCYNTRLYAGLPCGPISNPGLEALLAVAEPADTEYLYFLTGDDGLMYYSYTEEEHNENAALHCQDLCQVSL